MTVRKEHILNHQAKTAGSALDGWYSCGTGQLLHLTLPKHRQISKNNLSYLFVLQIKQKRKTRSSQPSCLYHCCNVSALFNGWGRERGMVWGPRYWWEEEEDMVSLGKLRGFMHTHLKKKKQKKNTVAHCLNAVSRPALIFMLALDFA